MPERLDDRTLCRAVLHGTVCASFAVGDFSVEIGRAHV